MTDRDSILSWNFVLSVLDGVDAPGDVVDVTTNGDILVVVLAVPDGEAQTVELTVSAYAGAFAEILTRVNIERVEARLLRPADTDEALGWHLARDQAEAYQHGDLELATLLTQVMETMAVQPLPGE